MIAVILFEICPHAAHIERLWCVMDGIHTKSRNRLALSTVAGAASIKLEIARSRSREASNSATISDIVSANDEESPEISEALDGKLIDESQEAFGIGYAFLEYGSLEDGPLDLLTWLDENAGDSFDRFVTLEELFGSD